MNDNIISPTLTNGITITVMAFVGLAAVFFVVQAVKGIASKASS